MSATTAHKPRLLYIDNLRITLIVLVIMHHFAIGYGAPGGFYYREYGPMSTVSEILLTLMLAINQAFFMGFFFMISSYFSPGSVDRKGTKTYLIDRFKRLGIPLLFYILVIDPLLIFITRPVSGETGTLWESLSLHYSDIGNFGTGQLWFVAALLIFSVAYVIWRRVLSPAATTNEAAPNNAAVAMFALMLGIVTFIVRIWQPVGEVFIPLLGFQAAHFPQYIALFIAGLVAYRRSWFETVTDAQGRFWSRIVVALVVLFPVLLIAFGALEGNVDAALGGLHWESFVYATWEQFMCVAMIIALLVWFRRSFSEQGRLAKSLSNAAYATYVFHAPTIIILAIALSGLKFPDMGLKYITVVPFAVMAAFAVGSITRRLPFAKDIL